MRASAGDDAVRAAAGTGAGDPIRRPRRRRIATGRRWDESNGADRRIALQRVVFSNDGAFTRLPTTPVTDWGANTRPAIAATTGGVIVAWVDDRAGRSTIALRPVGLETLCADPKAAAPAPLTFEWALWPSHTTTTHRHHD